jgi:hypothetical protein
LEALTRHIFGVKDELERKAGPWKRFLSIG